MSLFGKSSGGRTANPKFGAGVAALTSANPDHSKTGDPGAVAQRTAEATKGVSLKNQLKKNKSKGKLI